MFKFFKYKAKHTDTEQNAKLNYAIWYNNTILSPLNRDIRYVTRRIYTKLEAARVFPQEDNPHKDKLMKTIEGCRNTLNAYIEEYDLERITVVGMIDEYNLEMSYPSE
jgi:hypothetical protein